jgi:hypothetical protein
MNYTGDYYAGENNKNAGLSPLSGCTNDRAFCFILCFVLGFNQRAPTWRRYYAR